MKKERLLTVGYTYYDGIYNTEKIPYIRLMGKWLKAAGFSVGDLISVEPQEDGLLIRRMDRLQLLVDSTQDKAGPSGKAMMLEIENRVAMLLPVKEPQRESHSQK